eukprot:19847-Heterococcus_DN1.PRE.2
MHMHCKAIAQMPHPVSNSSNIKRSSSRAYFCELRCAVLQTSNTAQSQYIVVSASQGNCIAAMLALAALCLLRAVYCCSRQQHVQFAAAAALFTTRYH